MQAPTLLARLRADPATAALPVLVLSQAGWPEDARAALAAGASAFVVKPSRAGVLRSVLVDFWRCHAD
jgi:CheY-like chemotaxis protein